MVQENGILMIQEINNENYFHGADEPISGRKVLVRIDGPLVDKEGLKKYLETQIVTNNTKFE